MVKKKKIKEKFEVWTVKSLRKEHHQAPSSRSPKPILKKKSLGIHWTGLVGVLGNDQQKASKYLIKEKTGETAGRPEGFSLPRTPCFGARSCFGGADKPGCRSLSNRREQNRADLQSFDLTGGVLRQESCRGTSDQQTPHREQENTCGDIHRPPKVLQRS